MKPGRITLLLFFCLNFSIVSAINHSEYGEITKPEINLKECSFERDAEAIYLRKSGEIKIERSKVFIRKHIRIKILSEAGLKHANVYIPFYIKNGYEYIQYINAQTINVDQNDKVRKHEVSKNWIYTVDISEDWKEKRITFPNVKVGSIIEYEYLIVSKNFLYLNQWEFQENLPTLHSDLKVQLPGKLEYKVLLQGYRLLRKYRDELTNYWELSHLPSIQSVSYLYNIHDYTEKIRFQLSGYQLYRDMIVEPEYKTLMMSWEELANYSLNSFSFRSYLNKTRDAKSILDIINIKNLSQLDKLKKIYNYVSTNYLWNGKYRRFTYQKFDELIESKSGYSSEVNLLLTLLLQEGGLEAYPMLISTRSHGDYMKDFPFLSQFNHQITYVIIDKTPYYLDATDPLRPYFLLPEEAYVTEGFVLNKNNPQWHVFKYVPVSYSSIKAQATLDQNDTIGLKMLMKFSGYSALENRKLIASKGEIALINHQIKPQWKISFPVFKSQFLYDKNKDLEFRTNFELVVQGTGKNIFYLNPIFTNIIEENPFKSDIRNFPMQYPYPERLSYESALELPENVELLEWPESIRIKLPNNYGEFSYVLTRLDSVVHIFVEFILNEREIPSSQYKNLKEYYSIILSKLQEQIVYRKI